MPIYAYKCESCGHRQDVLQKISDPVLTTCPSCGAQAFAKQVTAAGFQLKGSGWYVTDFRDGGAKAKAETAADAKAEPAASTKADTKAEPKVDSKPQAGAAAPAASAKAADKSPAGSTDQGSGSASPAPAPTPSRGA